MITLDFFSFIDYIPSENFLYRPAFNRGHSYLYKDQKITTYQEKLKEEFNKFLINDSYKLPPKELVKGIVSCYVFGITPDRYFEKDLTNMLKSTEDAILGIEKSLLPYDDSLVVAEVLYKRLSDKNYVFVTIGILLNEDNDLECLQQIIKNTDKILYE